MSNHPGTLHSCATVFGMFTLPRTLFIIFSLVTDLYFMLRVTLEGVRYLFKQLSLQLLSKYELLVKTSKVNMNVFSIFLSYCNLDHRYFYTQSISPEPRDVVVVVHSNPPANALLKNIIKRTFDGLSLMDRVMFIVHYLHLVCFINFMVYLPFMYLRALFISVVSKLFQLATQFDMKYEAC